MPPYLDSQLSKFDEIFKDYVSDGISNPVFYGDLVYKLKGQMRREMRFALLEIVKRLWRRKYDPVII